MKKAFTLAEVLITLAIIGIVAALTIPTLVANYQKRQYVVQLQKVYSSLANAAKMVMADEQVDNLNNTYLRVPDDCNYENEDYENSVGKFLNKYFKVVKICTEWDNNINECFADSYKDLNGDDNDYLSPSYCAALATGATICLSPYYGSSPMTVDVDVNGKNGPNVTGRDIFELAVNYRGEVAESFNKDSFVLDLHKPENCKENAEQVYYGIAFGCFNKIIQDGWKMDY